MALIIGLEMGQENQNGQSVQGPWVNFLTLSPLGDVYSFYPRFCFPPLTFAECLKATLGSLYGIFYFAFGTRFMPVFIGLMSMFSRLYIPKDKGQNCLIHCCSSYVSIVPGM